MKYCWRDRINYDQMEEDCGTQAKNKKFITLERNSNGDKILEIWPKGYLKELVCWGLS
jgi:hypothetical protein